MSKMTLGEHLLDTGPLGGLFFKQGPQVVSRLAELEAELHYVASMIKNNGKFTTKDVERINAVLNKRHEKF